MKLFTPGVKSTKIKLSENDAVLEILEKNVYFPSYKMWERSKIYIRPCYKYICDEIIKLIDLADNNNRNFSKR